MQGAHASRLIRERRVNAVIFDLDGTLVEYGIDYDEGKRRSLRRLADVVPATVGFDLGGLVGLNSRGILRMIRSELGMRYESIARRIMFEEYEKVEMAAAARIDMREGVRELLEELRDRGYKILVVTNNSRRPVRILLKRYPSLEELVDVIFTRDELPEIKPDPIGISVAASVAGTSPKRTIVVGDTPSDILAARGAGALAVGVLGGASGEKELLEAGAHVIVRCTYELRSLLP